MPVNHVKEYLISVHTSVVFSHFYVRASNCCHYSNFRNKCPKLGTGTPEDMLFTNLGDNLDSVPSGIALINMCLKKIEFLPAHEFFWCFLKVKGEIREIIMKSG